MISLFFALSVVSQCNFSVIHVMVLIARHFFYDPEKQNLNKIKRS